MMEKEVIVFAGKKLNWDDDTDLIPLGDSRNRMDIVYSTGDMNVLESRTALTTITISGISGTGKKTIGSCIDIENNAMIFLIYTSGYDYIYRVYNDNTYTQLSYGDWGFSPLYPAYDVFIIGTGDDKLLCFNDRLNPPRCVNLKSLADGDYTSIAYNEVNLLKPAPTQNLALTYNTTVDPSTTEQSASSKLRGKRFQFAISYVYDNGMESAAGHWSGSIFDYRDEFINGIFDRRHKEEFSRIQIDIPVLYDNIESIKIFVKNVDLGSGLSGSWGLYDTWEVDYDEVSLGVHSYYFYNDKQSIPVDQTVFRSLYDNVPFTAGIMKSINGDRILFGGINSGRANVTLDVTLSAVAVNRTLNFGYFENTGNIRYVHQHYNAYHLYEANAMGIPVNWLQWGIVIVKDEGDGVIAGIERYYYQHYISATSGGSMSNATAITALVADINKNTEFAITASVISEFGGSPYKIGIAQSGGTAYVYRFYTMTYPALEKRLTWKTNSKINLAVCYYDSYDRNGRALIQNISTLDIPPGIGIDGWYDYYVQYVIGNHPPSWAVCYQFMYAGNNISSYFTIPIIMGKATDETTIDAEYLTKYTKIDIDQAVTRCYETNEELNLNVFTLKKGDRARIIGYQYFSTAKPVFTTEFTFYYKSINEYIDVEILGLDEDGKILLPNLSSYTESTYFNTRGVYTIEFYRPQSLDKENSYYYEIGDLIPISYYNGYLRHEATTVSGSGIEANFQEFTPEEPITEEPAIGVINFGDTFKFQWHFFDVLKLTTESLPYDLSSYIFPYLSPVESMSSSFMYDSKNLPTGRHNWVDNKAENKTEEALIYGGLYRTGDLNYNDLNKFIIDPIYDKIESKYGEITGIEQRGDALLVTQKKKLTTIYLNRQETQLADGSTALVYSNAVLGTNNLLPYELGCSHTGSIQKSIYNIYFFDLNTSAWYRFGQDGLNNITYSENNPQSGAKMKKYGIYLSKIITAAIKRGDTIEIASGYDPIKDMYIFTYINSTTTSENVTLGYHEPTNSWMSFYSYYHNNYIGFNENRFFSSVNGILYEHHISSTRVATGLVQFHFNKFPVDRKIFRAIEVNADQVWAPTEEDDIIVDADSKSYQNPISFEWIYGKMSSLLKEIHFIPYEGAWRAIFKKNMLNKKGVSNGKIGLENGELLRGKTASVNLRNSKTDENTLLSVTIGYEKSK